MPFLKSSIEGRGCVCVRVDGIGGLVGGDGGVRVGKLGGVSGEGVIGAMGAAVVADMVGSVVGDTGVSDAMGDSWVGSDVTGAF